MHKKLKGLYAITDSRLAADGDLLHQVVEALAGGASIIQYRDKSCNKSQRFEEANALAELCRSMGALLIINDDVELARAVDADGVHLGCDDAGIGFARKQLGPDAIIGVSCYNQFDRALQAQRAGADYAAFGRFFPSTSKPDAIQATPDLLRRARQELMIPTVAIGGITPENGSLLIEAGADMLAVIHGIFGQTDIRTACEKFKSLFNKTEVLP